MREGLFDHHRYDTPAALMATINGLVQGEARLGPVPEGYVWYVENIGYVIPGASHSGCMVAAVNPEAVTLGGPAGVANWDGAGLILAFGVNILNSFNPTLNGVYLGPGHVLHLNASNIFGGSLANGDRVVFTLQTAVHQLDPHLGIMSPDDARQVREEHERTTAELNRDAVGATAV